MAHKPTKKQLEKIRQLVRQEITIISAKSRRNLDWKFWVGLGIAVLGLILTAIGLRARPTVSLESPLNSNDVFATPFVISNDGILDLENVEVASFLIQARYENGGVAAGIMGINYIPPSAILQPGERETVPFRHFLKIDARPIDADMALIVTFTPQFLPFFKKTKAFRFVTARQANGTLRLQQEPENGALQQYEQLIENARKQFHIQMH